MCCDAAIWPRLPSIGGSGCKIGRPSLSNARGAKLVPPTFPPSEYRQASRKAAETFANRRPPSQRQSRIQNTPEYSGRAHPTRRRVRLEEANSNPDELLAQARLPAGFAIQRRGWGDYPALLGRRRVDINFGESAAFPVTTRHRISD